MALPNIHITPNAQKEPRLELRKKTKRPLGFRSAVVHFPRRLTLRNPSPAGERNKSQHIWRKQLTEFTASASVFESRVNKARMIPRGEPLYPCQGRRFAESVRPTSPKNSVQARLHQEKAAKIGANAHNHSIRCGFFLLR